MKNKLLCVLFTIIWLGALGALDLPTFSAAPQISVSITGFIKHPGTYYVSPSDRLSNLYERAMLDAPLEPNQVDTWDKDEESHLKLSPIPAMRQGKQNRIDYEKHQSLRQIILKRGGSEEIYDLLRFYRLGEIAENPPLKDGDIILIGVVEAHVGIEGAVAYPGDIEYSEGDTLEDILRLAQGPLSGANQSTVYITRYGADNASSQFIVDISSSMQGLLTALYPKDRINIPFDALYNSQKTVFLSGKLANTGEFLVNEDATLWDLIQQAGGLSPNADLANAIVLNRSYSEEPNAEFERLKLRSMQELTPLEYSYMRTQMRQYKGLYSVDFELLFSSEGREGNRVLNNYDHIFIPEKLDVVWVSGQVKRPGLVSYKEGENWNYYIEKAGGYSSTNALYRGVRILRSHGGNWVKPKSKTELKPGDIVFVPDKIDRQFWTDVKDIVTVTASAITILIGVQNLRKQ